MKRLAVIALAFVLAAALAGPALAAARFVDDSGQAVEVERPFRRIISLYGAHTENLFALGLDREIIGVSRHESYPPAALEKPTFHYRDDAERFIAARPDLILIRPMIYQGYRALVEDLKKAGLAVVSLQPTTVEAMLVYWRRLGLLTGRRAEAENMVRGFKDGLARVRAVRSRIAPERRQRVYFESIHRQMKTFAPSSMAVFALTEAGGINAAADAKSVRGTNIAAYGKERILARAGRIDIYLAQRGTMNRVTVRDILEESGFGAIKAVRQGRVYLIEETLVSRPTQRLLDGIYKIGRLLYPKEFDGLTRPGE